MVNNLSASPSCRRRTEKRGSILTDAFPFLSPGNVDHPFTTALQDVAQHQLRQDAWKDVRNMGLTGLGVGAAGAGLLGLVRGVRRNLKPKPHRTPSYLPLPLPVEDKEKEGLDDHLKRDLAMAGGMALAGGGVGGLLGALNAPKGYRREGAMRGALSGVPGGVAAFALGKGLKSVINPQEGASHLSQALGAASGFGTAKLLGGVAGSSPTMLMGRPSWEVRPDNIRHVLSKHVKKDVLKRETAEKKAAITTKAGLPWYGPAMLFGGLGGLTLGWKGIDSILKRRATKEREQELDAARQEFHSALLSQYDKPMSAASVAKAAADAELGRELDRLYDSVQTALEKRATVDDVLGATAGGYGMYAGLTGLLTGALVFDKMRKRSRQAILSKALAKRERRRFAMQPTEIHALPEPVPYAAAGSPPEG